MIKYSIVLLINQFVIRESLIIILITEVHAGSVIGIKEVYHYHHLVSVLQLPFQDIFYDSQVALRSDKTIIFTRSLKDTDGSHPS